MRGQFDNEAILKIRGLVEELQGALRRLQEPAPQPVAARRSRPFRIGGGGSSAENPLRLR